MAMHTDMHIHHLLTMTRRMLLLLLLLPVMVMKTVPWLALMRALLLLLVQLVVLGEARVREPLARSRV